MYLLAIVFPPLAVLLTAGFLPAVLNLVLWVFGFIPGIIHALFVVSSSKADRRSKSLENVMKETAILNAQTIQAGQISTKTTEVTDQIERLAKLKEAGHLTQEEFDLKKQQLLS
ncbi:YqaE/Pmp3 family membrane protein [Candidatus Woesebacteria bacterium]|nr:YqaE/Pmp3 family membrane protein [Candidatus Woesebacteria bacterium]